MPLPPIDLFCGHLELDDCFKAPGLRVRFPGGGQIVVPLGAQTPKPSEVTSALLTAVNSALMPFGPLFDVFDILLAVKKTFDAVASLDPIQIGNAVAKFAKKVMKLVGLLPPLSIPVLVKDLLLVLICLLNAVSGELKAISAQLARINNGKQRGLDLNLDFLIDASACAEDDLNFKLEAMRSNAEPLNRFIGVINVFLELAQQKPLPDLELGGDAEAMVETLDQTVATLKIIYQALPG